jgi:putative glycosyltransferase (TIGR04372 family)
MPGDRVTESAAARAVPHLAYSGDANPGAVHQHPFRIVSLCLDRTIGDFAASLVFALTIKARFDHNRLGVYYRDDRPFKRAILDVCPGLDAAFAVEGLNHYPVDIFDRAGNPPLYIQNDDWYVKGWRRTHLVLTPAMAANGNLGGMGPAARFRFPHDRADVLGARLADQGVDPGRWYGVIHHREPTFANRPAAALRDVDPEIFAAVCGRIIDELGGQVVRIGHPGMTPFPARAGFIDLSSVGEAEFALQLFAISRARFMLATDSGPPSCGSAFGTPTAMCCTPSLYCLWNPADACMRLHIVAPDGRLVSPRLAKRRALYSRMAMEELVRRGYTLLPQSEEEIVRLAKLMHDRTCDTTGWRQHWYEAPEAKRPNTLPWPPEKRMAGSEVEFADLAPGRGVIDIDGP